MSSPNSGIAAIEKFMRELNTADCDRLVITPESTLNSDLGLNSLSVLLLVLWIKDNVNSRVFDSIDNVVSLVKVSDILALMDHETSMKEREEVRAEE